MGAISGDWQEALRSEFHQPYYKELYQCIRREYETSQVFPPAQDIFNAYHYTPLEKVKVVILGQDPYHGEGQAHGLSFSVRESVPIPPSLQNIYKELHEELGLYIPNNGYLVPWARQGVMMLNTVLTVRAHQPLSHKGLGWEQFTDATIRVLSKQERPIVYLLWGRPSRMKASMLHNPRQLVLEAAHPSPLSAYNGFFGCGHFQKANAFLVENGETPIDWQIPNL